MTPSYTATLAAVGLPSAHSLVYESYSVILSVAAVYKINYACDSAKVSILYSLWLLLTYGPEG